MLHSFPGEKWFWLIRESQGTQRFFPQSQGKSGILIWLLQVSSLICKHNIMQILVKQRLNCAVNGSVCLCLEVFFGGGLHSFALKCFKVLYFGPHFKATVS